MKKTDYMIRCGSKRCKDKKRCRRYLSGEKVNLRYDARHCYWFDFDSCPPLGSQINWGHPLSKGLVGCWLMNEGRGK